jgi:hypothetical protein
MALTREPEKAETQNFQCPIPTITVRRWKTLVDRAGKQRINLRKAFAEHFNGWLDEVEAELNTMTVRPIRSKAEE